MTQQEILEGNKLIAKFMELHEDKSFTETDNERKQVKTFAGSPMYNINGVISNLRYNFSWDWLIPLCHKIAEINCEIEQIDILKMPQWEFGSLGLESPIEAVWKACVEFIKWYNQNKNE